MTDGLDKTPRLGSCRALWSCIDNALILFDLNILDDMGVRKLSGHFNSEVN